MKGKFWRVFFAVGAVAAVLAGGHMLQDHEKPVKKVPTSHKVIALTFDDGPHRTTTALLGVLASKQVHATFFVVGENVVRFPKQMEEIVAGGHEVANHSYDHRVANRISREEFFADLEKTEAVITKIAPKPVYFRPPGGGYNDRLVSDLRQHGYTTVLWSIDPRDWDHSSAERTAGFVVQRAAPGGIILLHEGPAAAGTPAAVATIIDRLQEEGYTFVTISELMQYYEIRH